MAAVQELNQFFCPRDQESLAADIAGELQSVSRIHDISAEDVFFKWEAYSIQMGSDNTKLDIDTVRAFKKELQEQLERDSRAKKTNLRNDRRGVVTATPRANKSGDEIFGMLDQMTETPTSGTRLPSSKRKSNYETPTSNKVIKAEGRSSPPESRPAALATPGPAAIPFAERQNPGQVVETLNDNLSAFEPPMAPHAEPQVKLTLNTDIKKFSYKPMAMNLSEASEVLDERIDDFISLVQDHHQLEDSMFGNAASKSTNEIVAIGRIASDTSGARLNLASAVLETSRRTGNGLRIPLKFETGLDCQLFPGQIVALKGINASGEYFAVSEVLDIPLPPPATSAANALLEFNATGDANDSDSAPGKVLSYMIATGPYTADDNLAFEPLHALCEKAVETSADVLFLIGPFLDAEHPMIAIGDFDVPFDSDSSTLVDVFRHYISAPLKRLVQAHPSITIILIPSARDAVSKHIAWPQEAFNKKELGFPRQIKVFTNPVTITVNEVVIGISAQDILYDLQKEEVIVGKVIQPDLLARLPRHLIQQRHFFPIFPPHPRTNLPKSGTEDGLATGTPLDVGYLKLGEWLHVKPDLLITPSALRPFAKVIEGVVVVNPGPISKRRGAGTYAVSAIHPRKVTPEELENPEMHVGHKLYERARIDIVRI